MTVPYQFVELKPIKFEMPTLYPSCDWLKESPEYHLSQSNVRPVEANKIELDAEIERLKNELVFQRESLIKYQNSTQAQIDDYKNLHADYLNSQSEVKRLQAQVDKIPGLKRTMQWLMIEHLEMDIKISSVQEMKEVDRTWL